MVSFGRKAELLQTLTSSRPKLRAALQLMQTCDFSSEARGGTLLYDAPCLASNELMKARQGRTALVVLSDGTDQGSTATLADAVEATQRVDIPVYSILLMVEIGFPPPPNRHKILERLSTETGGHTFTIFHGLTVAQIYAQVQKELRNEYVLAFVPTPAETSSGYHRIHLTTKHKGLTVQARDGYYSDR